MTDYLEQYVRCYTVPDKQRIERRKRSRYPKWAQQRTEREMRAARVDSPAETTVPVIVNPDAQAIKALGAPYEGWCLVFDTETTTDTRQALRYGFYQIHGISRDQRMRLYHRGQLSREALDRLHEEGVFYDPDTLSQEEIATIQAYAAEHDLECVTRMEFMDLYYKWVYKFRALPIGHNLPFDQSRFATNWTAGAGQYRGGFTMPMCTCPYRSCLAHPPIRLKLLGKYKVRMAFQKQKRPDKKPPYTGTFLDTATLGRALIGPGDTSLSGLGKRFNAQVRKQERPDLTEPVNFKQLDYAQQDVAATWSLYQAERELYRRHGVSTPMWQIYSEASLGKAYLKELGVPRFLQQHPEVPPEVHGYGMVAYYGGRSKVRIRLQPTEVLYADFKSQYATVNALMGLQDLLVAQTITIRDATMDVRQMLATLSLEQLQTPAFWRRLRVLVNIKPDGDLLPLRAEYGPDGRNIADVYLTGPATWYTLADVVASTLRTGTVPEVLEAQELLPTAEHVQTHPWKLFGDERYQLDLAHQDFFTEVINLRSDIKAERDRAKQEGRAEETAYLGGLQQALKLLAASTSYGVLVEVNAEEPVHEPLPVTVHGLHTYQAHTTILERPGPYFAGAVGALIPAGGRLLLAIADQLAADRGIGYAMCDTDSMAFARPEDMSHQEFAGRVKEIREWFTPLSPYRGKPPIFEDEDVNEWNGRAEPLYLLGVSAKRYVLYNQLADRTYRIRKFSSHGVGTWKGRDGYQSPPHVPDPCDSISALGGERWHYDLWYDFIVALETGKLPSGVLLRRDEQGVPQYVVPDTTWLVSPAFHRVTISTPHLLREFHDIPDIRPFNFITVLPALTRQDIFWRHLHLEQAATRAEMSWEEANKCKARYEGLSGVSFYAPYATQAADVRDVRRSDTHEVTTTIEHRTLAECLRDYYRHPEWKSEDPSGVGVLPRRHIVVTMQKAIGKESNQRALASAEDTDGVIDGVEAGMDGAQVYTPDGGTQDWQELLRSYRLSDLMVATGLPRRTLSDLRNGRTKQPSQTTREALTAGVWLLGPHNPRGISGWRDMNNDELAVAMGVDWTNRDIQRIRNGQRVLTEEERDRCLAVVRRWLGENRHD